LARADRFAQLIADHKQLNTAAGVSDINKLIGAIISDKDHVTHLNGTMPKFIPNSLRVIDYKTCHVQINPLKCPRKIILGSVNGSELALHRCGVAMVMPAEIYIATMKGDSEAMLKMRSYIVDGVSSLAISVLVYHTAAREREGSADGIKFISDVAITMSRVHIKSNYTTNEQVKVELIIGVA